MKRLLLDAKAGDAGAQFNLGVMLHLMPAPAGQPAKEKRAEVIEWLLKSAHQGLARAHLALATVYAEEPRVRGDEVRACTWFLVAASSARGIHQHRAETEYKRLVETMRPGQLTRAKRDARTIVNTLREYAAVAA